MPVSSIGQLITRGNVETAVVTTLQTWVLTYLAEVERQNNLAVGSTPRPPDMTKDIYGALDLSLWQDQNTPALVVVAQPFGDAELHSESQWDQWFDVQATAIIATADAGPGAEAWVRGTADVYGAAIMAAIMDDRATEPGTLAGLAQRVRLVSTPKTEFISPEWRNIAQSTCRFRALVEGVVDDAQGPSAPVNDGTPTPWPLITTTDLTFTAVPLPDNFT